MTSFDGRLGRLGDQDEPLPRGKDCARKRQTQGYQGPCKSRDLRTVLREAQREIPWGYSPRRRKVENAWR
jgi:hypothetical protein